MMSVSTPAPQSNGRQQPKQHKKSTPTEPNFIFYRVPESLSGSGTLNFEGGSDYPKQNEEEKVAEPRTVYYFNQPVPFEYPDEPRKEVSQNI